MYEVGGECDMYENRNAYRVLVGRPEVKRPLGRPKRRWVDIKLQAETRKRVSFQGG